MRTWRQVAAIVAMNLRSIPQRWGRAGAFAACVGSQAAPASAAPRRARPAQPAMDGSKRLVPPGAGR